MPKIYSSSLSNPGNLLGKGVNSHNIRGWKDNSLDILSWDWEAFARVVSLLLIRWFSRSECTDQLSPRPFRLHAIQHGWAVQMVHNYVCMCNSEWTLYNMNEPFGVHGAQCVRAFQTNAIQHGWTNKGWVVCFFCWGAGVSYFLFKRSLFSCKAKREK